MTTELSRLALGVALLLLSLPAMAQTPCRDHTCSNDSLTPPVVGDEIASFTLPPWPDCDGTASADTTPGRLERFDVLVLETGQTPDQGRICYSEPVRSLWSARRGTYDWIPSQYKLAALPPSCFPDPGVMTRTVVRMWWTCKGGELTSTTPTNEVWNWVSWEGQPYAWLSVNNGVRCERRMSPNAPRRFTQFPECPL